MQKIFRLKIFWTMAIILSVVIFTVAVNTEKEYASKTQILVVPTNEIAARNIDQITENLALIPKTLAFLNRLTLDNPNLEKSTFALPDYEKRDYWNSQINVEHIKGSSIIKISAKGDSQAKAYDLSNALTQGIINSAGLFYNVKDDINLRIIENPVIYSQIGSSWIFLILKSIIPGFVLVFLAFLLSFSLFKEDGQKKSDQTGFISWLPKKEKPPVFSEEPWVPEKKVEDKKTEVRFTPERKASAPDNLPIAENIQKEEAENKPQEKKPIIKEATPEEVKERLNKLLSGRL